MIVGRDLDLSPLTRLTKLAVLEPYYRLTLPTGLKTLKAKAPPKNSNVADVALETFERRWSDSPLTGPDLARLPTTLRKLKGACDPAAQARLRDIFPLLVHAPTDASP